jgi:predicted RND superfamily exporter protein
MSGPRGDAADLPAAIAHFVVTRRRWIQAGAALVIIISIVLLVFRVELASDVLDLLPQRFDSVRTFKTYDREFSQARELTFAIVDESKQCDLEAFVEHFAEMGREEPWVLRVMNRSPAENPDALEDVGAIAAPLLLNLPAAEFDRAAAALDSDRISARLAQLHAELESGSPRAQFELEVDPLGVVRPALEPLLGSLSGGKGGALTSPDGTMRLVIIVTKQSDLGAHACQATMRQVEAFNRRALANWSGPRPEILVTGRTAYVAELSLKMREDVTWTLAGSIALVTAMFWIGFRRFRPLLAILNVLLVCCLVAVTAGTFIFRELNMITIGLCSILIGLGIDFGMMLYGIYQVERDHGRDHESAVAAALRSQGRGVLFGASTTAAAFLCLILSECRGFIELGVLIALGILFAAIFMMTLFFVFAPSVHRPQRSDWFGQSGRWFVRHALRTPRRILFATALILLALGVFAIGPFGTLQFDANPQSLEPRDSHAGTALRTIMKKMPALGEPLFALLEARNAKQFHDDWRQLQVAWSRLVADGRIKSAATPAAFALDPELLRRNGEKLSPARLASARDALSHALEREGFSTDPFIPAFALLDSLRAIQSDSFDWRTYLPVRSSWWFILDRFLGINPRFGIGYIVPLKTLQTSAEKTALDKALTIPGIDLHISGWTYTLTELVPWAKAKLTMLSLLMIGFNIVLLAFLYHRFFPLFILMLSLALSMAAMIATLKIFHVPLNLFNVLAFPLVLGIGVDYGIYVVIAIRSPENIERSLAAIVKPVLLSGLTTIAGFASLVMASNPALRGLGTVCALGVGWCLFSTFFFVLPAYAWCGAK